MDTPTREADAQELADIQEKLRILRYQEKTLLERLRPGGPTHPLNTLSPAPEDRPATVDAAQRQGPLTRPSIGRIVHYRLDHGRNKGKLRPAIIVRVWADANPHSTVQLQVFTDAANDDLDPVLWKTSVSQGDDLGQWQWPEYVPPRKAG